MSTAVALFGANAVTTALPTALPVASIEYLMSVLTGAQPLDRGKGVAAAYEVAGYLLGYFFNTASAKSTAKSKRASNKVVAAALASLIDGKKAASFEAKAFPAWLIPILFELAKKWLENRK